MADSKKYNGSTWEHSLRKLETATDTITTLPVDLYADGNNATVGLVGNMSQTGTPTPQNPIQPQECGDRTGNIANMYDIDTTGLNLTFKTDSNMTIKINGTKQDGVNIRDLVHPNIMLPAGKYTIKIKMIGGSITNITGGVMFGINKSDYSMRTTPQVNAVGQVGTRTFTLNSDTLLTSLDITPSYSDAGAVFNNAVFQCWLYKGDSDIPYEPYGYKLDIKSGNTTTPVYLGEVESTRQIRKLVLTGEEGWGRTQTQRYYINASTGCPTDYLKQTITTSICSHYQSQNNTASGSNEVKAGHFCFYTGGGFELYIGETTISSAADFKSYLAQQYAAGTPVTVWYVLATEETGIVNEPLRKIGSYADTVSGISIPTITGKDTFDVLTTLKPSEVELTYTGWHDASVGEWDGSQWQ